MATLVMKFGGSLMADAKRISRVAQVILGESLAWNRMVVVVSAMAGATDLLNRALEFAAARNTTGYRRVVATLRTKHLTVINALFSNEALKKMLITQMDAIMFDGLTVCDHINAVREITPRNRDAVLAVGEKMIAHIVTALVRQEGLNTTLIDAESLIITDDTFQNAHPITELTDARVDSILRPVLDAGIVPLIAGFIGSTRNGITTTLGRGGSDYTATILAASLRADEVWIWTNVDGIMSADPALVPGARVIPVLSYEEIAELTYFGTRVIHPQAIDPLLPHGIPLRVRNPFNLDHAGTLIQIEAPDFSGTLKAVTAVDGIYLASAGQPVDMAELLGQVQRLVGQAAAGPVLTMQTHLHTVLVYVVPTSEGPTGVTSAIQKLSASLTRWEVRPVKVIALMGATPDVDNKLDIRLRSLAYTIGPGDRRLMAVSPADMQLAVRQLHKLTEPNVAQLWPQSANRPNDSSPK